VQVHPGCSPRPLQHHTAPQTCVLTGNLRISSWRGTQRAGSLQAAVNKQKRTAWRGM